MLFFVITVLLLPHLLALTTSWVWHRSAAYRGWALLLHILGAIALSYLSVFLLPWCYTSVYFPYLYGSLWLALLLANLWRRRSSPPRLHVPWSKWIIVGGLVFSSVLHFRAQQPPPATVDWPLPLKEGQYYVQQGGHSWLTNPFHHRYQAQSQAIDIVQLNGWGNRASGILPTELSAYNIYGDTVYSPVEGRVVRMRNDRPEPTPPTMDASIPLGNHIILQKGDTLVLMGHLIPGSIAVKEGDKVRTGTPLGRVGNSGRSSEPHLHYQVVVQSQQGWAPIGIRWQGRYPSTGDRLPD